MKSFDWLPLFKFALKILAREKVLKSQWSFGGGTALMTYYNHRKSKDLDIFQSKIDVLQNRLNILKKIYAIELKSLDIIDSQTAKNSLKIVQEFIEKLKRNLCH